MLSEHLYKQSCKKAYPSTFNNVIKSDISIAEVFEDKACRVNYYYVALAC